ncbi:hypothetical protein V6615_13550 [Oscillospiraceae bacterium PP1C4]
MQKVIRILSSFIFLLLILSIQVFADGKVTEINSLIENAKQYDGKTITVQGEAIGEPLERNNYCWVNINDGTNAIGIWLKSEDAQQVEKFGDYKNKGDIILVSGVFHRACAEHGGEADIHNQNMQVLKKGYAVEEQISHSRVIFAVILLAALLSVIFIIHKFKILKLPYHL